VSLGSCARRRWVSEVTVAATARSASVVARRRDLAEVGSSLSAMRRASSAAASAVSAPTWSAAARPGDDVVVLHVPVQQQNLDQSAGAGGVAVGVTGGCPPGFVDRGELARGPGLFEDRGAGQRARFAQQRFEIVNELEP